MGNGLTLQRALARRLGTQTLANLFTTIEHGRYGFLGRKMRALCVSEIAILEDYYFNMELLNSLLFNIKL